MFQSAAHVLISGGSFRQNINIVHLPRAPGEIATYSHPNAWFADWHIAAFQVLKDAVAPHALHDFIELPIRPGKLTVSQVAALEEAMEWIRSSSIHNSCIMWLNGAPRTGKSLILREVANICDKDKILLASFAFSRTNSNRSYHESLVATIAYQICLNLPASERYVLTAVQRDPLIFKKSLERQFRTLILEPLRQIDYQPKDNRRMDSPYVIIIDGLDRCTDRDAQIAILCGACDLLRGSRLPLLFLLGTRPEEHITVAIDGCVGFNIRRLSLTGTHTHARSRPKISLVLGFYLLINTIKTLLQKRAIIALFLFLRALLFLNTARAVN